MQTILSEQTTHLSEYYLIVLKYKWLIAFAALIGITAAVLYNGWMRPVYRTAATLVINKDQVRSPLTGETLMYENFISQSLAFNTHFRLLKSYPVLKDVVRKLKLDKKGEIPAVETLSLGQLFDQLKANFRLLMGINPKPRTKTEDGLKRTIAQLQQKISPAAVRDTLLMQISVEDHDPVQARDIANTVSKSYIQFDIANRLKTSQNTVSWMTDQLYEMKKKLEDAEKEFQVFKQREKLFSMEGKQGMISQKIDDFNSQYIQAHNRRLELDVKLNELARMSDSTDGLTHVRSLVDNPVIADLNKQLLELEVEVSRLIKMYKPKHPKMIQMSTQMAKIRKKLEDEIKKEVNNLKSERAVLRVREKALQDNMANFEDDALNINKKELQYAILQRNVETHERLYGTLLAKVKQSNIAENVEGSNLSIAEAAGIPGKPIRPRKQRNLMLGFFLGLAGGFGFAFFREYWDRSVKTEEDIRKYLDLSVLSVIPKAGKAKHKVY
jgi:polysaccharide biosynthesis transport protein